MQEVIKLWREISLAREVLLRIVLIHEINFTLSSPSCQELLNQQRCLVAIIKILQELALKEMNLNPISNFQTI